MSRRLWVMLFVAWVAVLAGAAYVFLNSPIFDVKRVQVAGNVRLSVEEILTVAGIPTGVNVFRAPLGDVAERVAGMPLVRSVTCRRRIPDVIEVIVVERKAAAITPHHNSFMVLDDDGWAMEVRRSPGGLPLVTVDSTPEMVVGRQVDSEPLRWAIRCAAAFGPWITEVAEIHCDSRGQITVYLAGGLRALVGQADATLEEKVGWLTGIMNDVRRSGLEVDYIDLRYGRPVMKPRQDPRPG